MRLLDERSRLFGLINPIDLLVLAAAIVAIVAVAVALFGAPGEEPQATVEIEFDVLAVRLEAFDADAVVPGDVLVEKTGGPLGEIESVSVEPAQLDVATEDGIVWVESATLKTVRIHVRAEAIDTDGGYLVRGIPIRENALLNVYTKRFQATKAYITAVEAAE